MAFALAQKVFPPGLASLPEWKTLETPGSPRAKIASPGTKKMLVPGPF